MANALVVDGDNTLWRGRVAEGIGKAYMLRELKRGHLGTVYRGYKGSKEVHEIVERFGGSVGEIQGQKKFYEILMENRLGTADELELIVRNYIVGHEVTSVSGMLARSLSERSPSFLATASGSTATEYAYGYFRMTGRVSNEEIFDGKGRLVGFRFRIGSGEEKLYHTEKMLDAHGLRMNECDMVGDSEIDIPLLKSAKRAIASPYATDEVRRICSEVLPLQ